MGAQGLSSRKIDEAGATSANDEARALAKVDLGRRANPLPPATSSNHSDIEVIVEIERVRLFRYGTNRCAIKAHNMTRRLRLDSLDRLMRERIHAVPRSPSTDARTNLATPHVASAHVIGITWIENLPV